MAGVRCANCNDAGCSFCQDKRYRGAPTGSERFHEVLRELGELHDLKARDYGTEEDSFANIRGSQEWGVEPWVGAMIRATDKVKRLQKLARHGELANEPAVDSFRDLAVYAVIALVLYEERHS